MNVVQEKITTSSRHTHKDIIILSTMALIEQKVCNCKEGMRITYES